MLNPSDTAATSGPPMVGYACSMMTTIDKAGRLVIPKPLRAQVGLVPGPVELTVDGGAIRLEPVASDRLVERNGRLVVPATGEAIDDELVPVLRHADQR